MKLGEIKIETLRLMFPDYLENTTLDNLHEIYDDDNFKKYLYSMNTSINRCFGRLEEKGLVPLKQAELTTTDGKESYGRIRFNLKELIPDFLNVNRVIYEDKYNYEGSAEYVMETNTTMLIDKREGTYVVVYHPELERLTPDTDDDVEIPLPERIASIMPYYIKGDLYTEDEPGIAASSRNLFESLIDEINMITKTRQNKVKSIYSQVEE